LPNNCIVEYIFISGPNRRVATPKWVAEKWLWAVSD